MQNFSGKVTGTVVVAAANANTPGHAVEIDAAYTVGKRDTSDALIYNPGPLTVRLRFGDDQITAHDTTPVCMPIPPGITSLDKGTATHVAVWEATGTQAIEVFCGKGA